MSGKQNSDIQRVVVRGTNWVGDCVMTIPALRALRRVLPNAHITLVVRPGVAELFEAANVVDEILRYDRRNALSVFSQVREWRRHKFQLAILFQNAFEAALIPLLAGVPARLGYATEGRQKLLNHPLPVPDWKNDKHEVFYYLYLIAALEQSLYGTSKILEADPDASIEVPEIKKTSARQFLDTFGLISKKGLVALCPGSINSRAKRWPAERFAALADRLIEDDRTVLLIGSPAEQEVSTLVVSTMKHKPIVLTGKTSLDQITSILSLADLLVTNDTGPAHIAAALNTPAITIFGPTNPLTTRPFSLQAEVLRHPPDCAPCMLRDCPIDHRCMTAITVEEVFDHAFAILKRRSFNNTVRSLCDSVA
ncbi:MAG TPA: lipopolysaccharide heptosyltransferase II [Pyrinomonadaceae bacterium]|nr:lipopolysaccharide heptosyltransferase II [Pyrinomonadaceae bacterium]